MSGAKDQMVLGKNEQNTSRRRSQGGQEVAKREPLAFVSDEEITTTLTFKTSKLIWLTYAAVMHDFSVTGVEKLPQDKPALLVGPHTFHSTDVFIGAMAGQHAGKRVVRGLMHRLVMLLAPWLRYLGLFPGHRDAARTLLREGNRCACIPGGIEEIFHHTTKNGAHAYEIWWKSHNGEGRNRKGFAEVALQMGPGFQVFPFFFENGEEMKWNPLFEVCTFVGVDTAYGAMLRVLPKGSTLEWVMWQVAIFLTFNLSLWTSLPVPVKVTMHIGEGVEVREGDTAQEYSDRVHDALQDLVDVKQGRRHRSYARALEKRFERGFVERLIGGMPTKPGSKPSRKVCFAAAGGDKTD